ncbi:MAG: hypothetical protein A2X36_03125 [Elusimicrobia bacterium GWA2_69_24]|nr:MAG: hypothetical protein A2X36_03125 [Elusimicrobia bacterium GWA2_69_24]
MTKRTIIIAGVLALPTGLGALLWAAQEAPRKEETGRRGQPPAVEDRVKLMSSLLSERLELTPDQQEAIAKLLLDKEKQVEKLDKEVRRIEGEANEKIRALLKIEQRDAYEEMRVMLRRGPGGRQGPGGGGPAQFGRGMAMGPRSSRSGGPQEFGRGQEGFGPGSGFRPPQGMDPRGPSGQQGPFGQQGPYGRGGFDSEQSGQ